MKRVSARVFFTVLWRGVVQGLETVFGWLGYKRDSKLARIVWGVFATSMAFIAASCAIFIIGVVGSALYTKYHHRNIGCRNPYCCKIQYVSRHFYFHNHEDGKGYIYNSITGEKTLTHVAWIAKPITARDSLVCFSDGKKRGYFSRNTGKVVIEPKYDHAWIFSGGIASVEEGGRIKFIDETGKVIIDKGMAYNPRRDGYVFHGNYCIVYSDDEEHRGLMDKKGDIVLPMEYDYIYMTNDFEYLYFEKDGQMAVMDKNLKTIIPMTKCSIYINEGTINMTMPDHTIRKYDMEGNLINDFYIYNVRTLIYEKDEIKYHRIMHSEESDEDAIPVIEAYYPSAIARLRSYMAGEGYEGLMTAEGHIVTMPLYRGIEAIGNDLYLCTTTNEDKVIINGKGEIVR